MEYVQNDIFSELYPKFTITKPIRLIEYKQAGNSICVPVLEAIFAQMLP